MRYSAERTPHATFVMLLSQTDTAARKSEARAYFLALRKSFPTEYSAAASDSICRGIMNIIEEKSPSAVLLYAPVRGEVDVMPLAHKLWQSGQRVAFPVSHKEGFRLEFRVVTSKQELRCGAYGIPEPREDRPTVEDFRGALCVVPALAADRQGYRLGYGAGYYDRFLSRRDLLTVCPIYERLLVTELPRERTDATLHILQTENEVIYTRG